MNYFSKKIMWLVFFAFFKQYGDSSVIEDSPEVIKKFVGSSNQKHQDVLSLVGLFFVSRKFLLFRLTGGCILLSQLGSRTNNSESLDTTLTKLYPRVNEYFCRLVNNNKEHLCELEKRLKELLLSEEHVNNKN